MTENGKTEDSDLKRGLIIATVITVICTIISGCLSITVFQLEVNVVSVLAMILILCIPFLVFSTWKHYREGNMQLAVKSRNSMLSISIIISLSSIFVLFLITWS